ncbi:hypothetical protein JTE90_028391 [Oedothorax gibbosus]|uniref:Uncharacterized protein n=1 Tax=Oedothorax gibbosus TaxID=931172 RepID=A0AAV6VDE5_9ARAC|nr:hypothetical protein JTE90_028391 [Oedothorax gibbosus]
MPYITSPLPLKSKGSVRPNRISKRHQASSGTACWYRNFRRSKLRVSSSELAIPHDSGWELIFDDRLPT